MDVILQPAGSAGSQWILKDRLGRSLGAVEASESRSMPFSILPEGALIGVPQQHKSLDEAMSAIAKKMGGTCELDSGDWG